MNDARTGNLAARERHGVRRQIPVGSVGALGVDALGYCNNSYSIEVQALYQLFQIAAIIRITTTQ